MSSVSGSPGQLGSSQDLFRQDTPHRAPRGPGAGIPYRPCEIAARSERQCPAVNLTRQPKSCDEILHKTRVTRARPRLVWWQIIIGLPTPSHSFAGNMARKSNSLWGQTNPLPKQINIIEEISKSVHIQLVKHEQVSATPLITPCVFSHNIFAQSLCICLASRNSTDHQHFPTRTQNKTHKRAAKPQKIKGDSRTCVHL